MDRRAVDLIDGGNGNQFILMTMNNSHLHSPTDTHLLRHTFKWHLQKVIVNLKTHTHTASQYMNESNVMSIYLFFSPPCAHARTQTTKKVNHLKLFFLSNKNIQIQIQIIWMGFWMEFGRMWILLNWILCTETRWHTHTHTVTAKITKWFLFSSPMFRFCCRKSYSLGIFAIISKMDSISLEC